MSENVEKVEIPNEEDVKEFMSMGENLPAKTVLDKDGQESVLDAIKNAEIKVEETNDEEIDYPIVGGEEECPHCGEKFRYSIRDNIHIVRCQKCGKFIPVCSKCHHDDCDCDNCLWCDVANFYNLMDGRATIEQFLGSLNPPLTDMTTTSNPMIDISHENFVNEVGGDSVSWDHKYWEIHGMIVNATMLSTESKESEIAEFVKEIIRKNKE